MNTAPLPSPPPPPAPPSLLAELFLLPLPLALTITPVGSMTYARPRVSWFVRRETYIKHTVIIYLSMTRMRVYTASVPSLRRLKMSRRLSLQSSRYKNLYTPDFGLRGCNKIPNPLETKNVCRIITGANKGNRRSGGRVFFRSIQLLI